MSDVQDYPRGLTFEKVWAMFQESKAESEREWKEIKEQMKETDRRMKETDKKIGALGNRFGELAEHLVAPGITEKFNEIGFTFEQISENVKIKDSAKQIVAEIDLLLENGDIVIAIEIKAKPDTTDIEDHIKRLELLRYRADLRQDKRRFQGAIAGAIMNDKVRNAAYKTGFYIIEQTGDTVKISIPENFIAREW